MLQPGRQYSAGSGYRYGFNGQERSTEIHNNSYTAEFWEYDSRIARRWNRDISVKSWICDYAVLGNNPIYMIDPYGADWYKNNKTGETKWYEGNAGHRGYTHLGDENYIFTTKKTELEGVYIDSKRPKPKGKGLLRGGHTIVFPQMKEVENVVNNLRKWWDSWSFTTTGEAKLSFGLQAEIKEKIKLNNENELSIKVGAGGFVTDIGGVKVGWDGQGVAEWGGSNEQIMHNYGVVELGGKIMGKQVGVGIKYDYNYPYYNGYYGPKKDGPGHHDWSAYIFGNTYGNKKPNEMFAPFSNPLTYKVKGGAQITPEKTFYGLDIGGSVKLLLGIEYKLKIGISID